MNTICSQLVDTHALEEYAVAVLNSHNKNIS